MERDQDNWNCHNWKDLTEVAFEEFDNDSKRELLLAKATKVWGHRRLRLYECPKSWITEETNDIINKLNLQENSKILYFGPNWKDQPLWFIEAYNIYNAELSEWRKQMKENSK